MDWNFYLNNDTLIYDDDDYVKNTFFFFSLTWVSGPACAHLD
jgi:hypothetical protein